MAFDAHFVVVSADVSTGTSGFAIIDPGATNSTVGGTTNATGTADRTTRPARSAPGAVDAQAGNNGASPSDACPDTDGR